MLDDKFLMKNLFLIGDFDEVNSSVQVTDAKEERRFS